MAGVFLAAGLLQTTLLAGHPWNRFRPDLILVLATAWALLRGPGEGAIAGAIGGLIGDLLTGRLIGLGVVTKTAVGALAGAVGERAYREQLAVAAGVAAVATLVDQTAYLAGVRAFGLHVPFWSGLWKAAPLLAFVNGVAMFIVYPLATAAFRRFQGAGGGVSL